MKEDKKYYKGQGFAIGMGAGIALGIPIGLAMDNIAIGPAIGIAIGAGLGVAFEENFKAKSGYEEIPDENRKKKLRRVLVIGILAGIAFVLLVIYLVARGN